MSKLLLVTLVASTISSRAQTLYVPSGTSGIGTSSNSNVGIGNNSPQAKLDVSASNWGTGLNISGSNVVGINLSGNTSSFAGADIYITRTSSSTAVGQAPTLQFSDFGSSSYNIIQGSSSGLQFYNSYSGAGWNERMRIASDGRIGIGNTTPGAQLDIKSGSTMPFLSLTTNRPYGSSRSWGFITNYVAEGDLVFLQSTTNTNAPTSNRFMIDTNGNVGIGTPAPSNPHNWDKVLNIDGATNSRMVASSLGQNFRIGVYSHSTVNGSGGGMIGTETNHKLFFITNYTTQATLDVNGYLGVGVTSPSSMVHINSAVERNSFRIYKNTSTNNYLSVWQGTGGAALDPIGTGRLYLGYDQVTDTYVNGRLGIGTTNPDYPLTVNGSVHAKEVRVDLSVPGPDYVFEKEYKLTSLEDIKTYIDQNKHLPEVPSAKEMEKNGVQLGEMNLILLKKIEELTLYVLELKKENDAQNKTIKELMNKNN